MNTTKTSVKSPAAGDWLRIGLMATAVAVIAVLLVQLLATQIWPEIALFKPLDSYARSAAFVIVPAIAATVLFAWLARRSPQADAQFLRISVVVLLLSFIPDYILPVEHKTLLASSVAAFLHVVAGVILVAMLTSGYRRLTGAGR